MLVPVCKSLANASASEGELTIADFLTLSILGAFVTKNIMRRGGSLTVKLLIKYDHRQHNEEGLWL